MGSAQTIFTTSLLILTIMCVNTITGIESVESQILEMEGGAEKFFKYYNYIRNVTCIINRIGGEMRNGLAKKIYMGPF